MRHDVLEDRFGRRLDYLRLSITDSCNYRCSYCLPPGGLSLSGAGARLTASEAERLCRVFASLGVRKVRLTGGEPLLREDLIPLVRRLRGIEGLSFLALTTNGSRLSTLARPLARAGLDGVNVSLDSLDPARFRQITGRDDLKNVLEGLSSALAERIALKINVVAVRGLEREEVHAFCDMAVRLAIEVRFIEFMPLCGVGWRPDLVLPLERVQGWVEEIHDLQPEPRGTQVAETFAIRGARGRLGFIASLSRPFCEDCNRLRVTASGDLRPCLFSDRGIDLSTPLRRGATDTEMRDLIREAVIVKPKGAEELRDGFHAGGLPRIRILGG